MLQVTDAMLNYKNVTLPQKKKQTVDTRPKLSQFQSLKIRGLANSMNFRNVDALKFIKIWSGMLLQVVQKYRSIAFEA